MRGHSRKIGKKGCRLDVRKFSFTHRVVSGWNVLPEEVVTSGSLGVFKKKLDLYMDTIEFL